jgi:hypothetical protein
MWTHRLCGEAPRSSSTRRTDRQSEAASTAQFTLTFGAKDVGTGGAFKPMPSAVGKGYRQDYAGTDGNPPADLVVPGAGFVRPSKARCTLPTKEGESSRESCRCCWYDNSQ